MNLGPSTLRYNGGDRYWQRLDRSFHRDDGPAIIWADGHQEWWVNGQRHRDDGPAVIRDDGTQEWWINGKLHREDGPAIIFASGLLRWFLNGNPVDPLVHFLTMGAKNEHHPSL